MNRRGATCVEFAIVAPVFFLLVFGMIELGRFVMLHQQLTSASIVGCRHATLDGATRESVEQNIKDKGVLCGVRKWNLSISPYPFDEADYVTVTVGCKLSESWLPMSGALGERTITASHMMKREVVR